MNKSKFDIESMALSYRGGASLRDIAIMHNCSISVARYHIKNRGELRSKKEAGALAGLQGKKSHQKPGRILSDESKEKMRIARNAYWDGRAKGTRITSQGYVEFTLGPDKGRLEHVVIMERLLGRALGSDECVHHVNHDKADNSRGNLVVMSKRAHASLHASELHHHRERCNLGRFI